MKSTVIRKGITASVILGLGALLSACGGANSNNGGSSTSSSVTPTNIPANTPTNIPTSSSSSSSTVLPTSFSTYIYEDQGTFNIPIIKVYIDGQPVNLILDNGNSGLVVNQSAVNIPSSDYISNSAFSFNTFGGVYSYYTNTSVSGLLASATVCLNPSITNSCVIMPIGVLTSGTLYPGEPNNGVFGLADIGIGLRGYAFNGNSMTAFSYPYYLEQQTGINSYQISFNSLTNYYANVSQTQPIGQINFSNYTGNSNTLISYHENVSVTFGSYPTNVSDNFILDTASPFNFLEEYDLQAALANIIPNYSPSQQEGACAQYGWPNPYVDNAIVNSSYTISYTIQSYTGSFVTEPPTSFCSSLPTFNLLEGVTVDTYNASGNYISNSIELSNGRIFGLPAMLGHTFTFVLGSPGNYNQGIVQYLGIQ